MKLMKLFSALGVILALASPVWALEDSKPGLLFSNATANATSPSLEVKDYASTGLGVDISGTATVTIQARTSPDGTYRNILCRDTAAGVDVSAVTASANLQCNTAGMVQLQAVISGCGGCTVSVRSRITTAKSGGGGGSIGSGTAFPANPVVGQLFIVTDDSVVGACDSAAGVAVTLCRWNGSAWIKLGDGTSAGGALSSTDIDTSAELRAIMTDETGTGFLYFQGGDLGTPSAGVLTNATGYTFTNLVGTITDAQVPNTITIDLAATATALAANPANCAAGEFAAGITAAGVGEGCTALPTTIVGTANQISVSSPTGTVTLSIPATLDLNAKILRIPHSASLPGTCSTGDLYGADSATTGQRIYYCESANTWVVQGDGGGGGSIGGSTGATDNAILRADGVGGATLQTSGCTISDAGALSCTGGITAGTSGTGVFTMLEGVAPGAGANAGEHNLYFDSSDSKLKSHENGGVVVTYARTVDNLAVFAATTSTELAGVLSDEIGSAGGFMRGTGATITSPTFAGTAPVMADGVTWTFNPNGTNAGINVGSQAGLVGSPQNGDIWYDSTGNKYKCRENGVTVDCISTGAGSGDITDVTAGAGIAVATPGGPAPAVSWDASTFVNNVTLWDGANASRTLTINLSGTDPVFTFTSNTVNLSTGALQVGGVAVLTADSSATLTNKTLDAEGTGNVITLPKRIWLPAAGCNNATAGSIWDLPSSNPAVAACVTGTNTQKGVLNFADASNLSAQITWKLPSTWTGTMDANIKWYTSATSGDVVWQLATICVADAETDDPAFNSASTVTDTAKGTTLQTNDASITTVTVTGCAAGELMHVKIQRDSAHASDTLAATASLIGVELVVREAM